MSPEKRQKELKRAVDASLKDCETSILRLQRVMSEIREWEQMLKKCPSGLTVTQGLDLEERAAQIRYAVQYFHLAKLQLGTELKMDHAAELKRKGRG